MRAGVTFEEMLQDALRANREDVDVPGMFAPAHPHIFVHSIKARPRPKPTLFSAHAAALPQVESRPLEPRPSIQRPAHTLTKAQHRALIELNDLGANLDAAFTSFELRSAFRSLARRYHPDRHPEANDVELARLSNIFADVTHAYKRLLPVCEPDR